VAILFLLWLHVKATTPTLQTKYISNMGVNCQFTIVFCILSTPLRQLSVYAIKRKNKKEWRDTMSLAANLKRLRIRKGKSLQEVADAVDVTKSHIWQLEQEGKNANPTLNLLKNLAEYFDTTISALIGEDSGPMVFGHKFSEEEVDDDMKRIVIEISEQLARKKKDE
jgi:transcriptional regulator with XRE-family HTH domain|tara:strand:- start:269 stop:769 length:501 start_codon:yes stop_codon:yes gene_type:complete